MTIKYIELKDVGENHLSLLCNENQLKRGLNWSRRNWSLKINSMTRMEISGDTWRPGICSCYLMNLFMLPIFAVYSRDSLSHGSTGVTNKFNLNIWGSVTQQSTLWMEFDLSARSTKHCLQWTIWLSAKGEHI